MRRIVMILIIIGFAGYFAYTNHQEKAKEAAREKAEKQKMVALRTQARTEIIAMATRFSANGNWEEKLIEGDKDADERVSTAELERLWLTGKPILFQGFMKVVSVGKPGTYVILIDHLPRSGVGKLKVGTTLRLSLECPKEMVDAYLSENPKAGSRGALVAVVAKISSIDSFSVKDEKGGTEEIKRGNGKCFDMRYAGLFQELLSEK